MAKSNEVPVFLTGQCDLYERPIQVVTRADARGLKQLELGKFENHGRTFRLFQVVAETVKAFVDGAFGIGILLPFAKSQNKLMAPEHLHYSVPACADRGAHYGFNMSAAVTNKALPFPLPILVEAYS
jgi:hypothetical protein